MVSKPALLSRRSRATGVRYIRHYVSPHRRLCCAAGAAFFSSARQFRKLASVPNGGPFFGCGSAHDPPIGKQGGQRGGRRQAVGAAGPWTGPHQAQEARWEAQSAVARPAIAARQVPDAPALHISSSY